MNPSTAKARGGMYGGGAGVALATLANSLIPWALLPCLVVLADGVCDDAGHASAIVAMQSSVTVLVTLIASYAGAYLAKPNSPPAT
jgi:hypothetical protein